MNTALLDAIAISLPSAAPLTPASPHPGIAWWEITDGYLLDHLVTHLIAADRAPQAEALATDLRWIETRLHQRGATAPRSDLMQLPGTTGQSRARDLARITHHLQPTHPRHALTAILHSRLRPLSDWRDQVTVRQAHNQYPALINHWQPPDLPHPALQRVFTVSDSSVYEVAISQDSNWVAAGGNDSGSGTLAATARAHLQVMLGLMKRGSYDEPTGRQLAAVLRIARSRQDGSPSTPVPKARRNGCFSVPCVPRISQVIPDSKQARCPISRFTATRLETQGWRSQQQELPAKFVEAEICPSFTRCFSPGRHVATPA
ncbi:hypothetical protein OG501_03570 [Streptomyces niveus]|uniref:hypothetical protein n=1 Tax=Streptomyces niveus TaxID=193462 RepID=UPI0038661D09